MPEKRCSVEGCRGEAATGGLCHAHHWRKREHGDVREDVPVRRHGVQRLCTVDGCDRDHYAKGLCNGHYTRLRKKGKILPEEPIAPYRSEGL